MLESLFPYTNVQKPTYNLIDCTPKPRKRGQIPSENVEGLTVYQNIGLPLEIALHLAFLLVGKPHKHNPFNRRYADAMGFKVDCKTRKGWFE